ncbi:MAG TPA: hypothetical protein VMZ22_05445 [Acidimicrobiales bacterium]|nr:hypothetical protein [Acidimicrobiales bacterium]
MNDDALTALGLRTGEPARFRRRDNERWSKGHLAGIEADGSVRLIDDKGATLSLPLERIEVSRVSARGKTGWEPAPARGARTEQLGLL